MNGSTHFRSAFSRASALLVALVLALTLSACELPIVGNVDIPFVDSSMIPNISLPQISALENIELPLGEKTTVKEAREKMLAAQSSQLTTPAIREAGVLTVGVKTVTASAPLCVTETDGTLYGLDIDLASALADELGLAVQFVPVSEVKTGLATCDIVMNVKASESADVTVLAPYAETATVFFHRGDALVSAPTDLNGKSVGLQGGSVSENLLSRTSLKMNATPYENLNDAFAALAAGQVDYVLCDAYPGAYLAAIYEGISFAGSLETPVVQGLALSSTNTELLTEVQKAMETIQTNGCLEIVRTRWVGSMPTLTGDSLIQGLSAS